MTFYNFISKLNWRLMVVHFIACWFVYHALWQLGYLYDYNFIEMLSSHDVSRLIMQNKQEELNRIFKDYHGEPVGTRIAMDIYYAALAGLAGILIAFVISLILSIRNKWLWLNSLIVLLSGFGSVFINKYYWYHVKRIFMFPGIPFKSDWWFNFIGGMFMLAIGLTLFFWKRIIRFIDGRKAQPDEQQDYSSAIQ